MGEKKGTVLEKWGSSLQWTHGCPWVCMCVCVSVCLTGALHKLPVKYSYWSLTGRAHESRIIVWSLSSSAPHLRSVPQAAWDSIPLCVKRITVCSRCVGRSPTLVCNLTKPPAPPSSHPHFYIIIFYIHQVPVGKRPLHQATEKCRKYLSFLNVIP